MPAITLEIAFLIKKLVVKFLSVKNSIIIEVINSIITKSAEIFKMRNII